MRVLVQRVSRAQVRVGDRVTGRIDRGFMLLVGFTHADGDEQLEWMADKVLGLRLFADADDKMNLALADVGGGLLVVSQFTVFGDVRRGNRPSFEGAMEPVEAERLYERFVAEARARGITVATGRFRADMTVHVENDGPVTILVDSKRLF